MTDKLKPCPFCGRAVKLIGDERAVCSNCDIVMPFAAWNRRSGDGESSLHQKTFCPYKAKHTALLDAVREVIAAIEHREEQYGKKVGNVIAGSLCIEFRMALTRIIDQHECPLNTDIPASVTKPVGTGSGTKAVTMTPDE